MKRIIPVNNGNFRSVEQTSSGWCCRLLTESGGKLIPVDDARFWDFNIPQDYLDRSGWKLEKLSDTEIITALNQYIRYVDELRKNCSQANLYRNGVLIKAGSGHAKNLLASYVAQHPEAYPQARTGIYQRTGYRWLVGVDMNVKGVYYYDDLECRPVAGGIEIAA